MPKNKEMIPSDGKVSIAITAIVAASVTILGIVAIQMTMLVNADTKTKVNLHPEDISIELEKDNE